MRASISPIDKTITNKIITYFGALDVNKKILFGSNIFIIIYRRVVLRKIYLIKNVEGDNNGIKFNTLDQILSNHTNFICLSFEAIVLKK